MRKIFALFLFFVLSTFYSASADELSWKDKFKNFFSKNNSSPQLLNNENTQQDNVQGDLSSNIEHPDYDFSEKKLGDNDAPVKIIIFTSLTCPHCAGVHLNLMPIIKKELIDTKKAQVILADFPLEVRAMTGSLIASCLKGDKYFAFMTTLYQNQRQWIVANNLQEAILPYAKLAGLTEKQMLDCATNEYGINEMTRIRNLNTMQYKLTATPTLIIKGNNRSEKLIGLQSIQEIHDAIAKLYEEKVDIAPEKQQN
ncbi:MAG: DsbA family protein [Alphaproteobacteria bacterium]|nr:DsbA family protein [Alphaproteobacteria bacterium]